MSKPSFSARRRIFKREGGRCYYCNKSLTQLGHIPDGKQVPSHAATLDHVIPKSFGKEFDKPWNLVLSCGKCNRKKDNSYPRFKDFVLAFRRKYQYDFYKAWYNESIVQIKRTCSLCGRKRNKDPDCIVCNKSYQDFVTNTAEYLRRKIA